MTYVVIIHLRAIHIQLPEPVLVVPSIILKANIPMSLLLLGIDVNFAIEQKYIKTLAKFLIFRYGLAVVAGIALYMLLPFDGMMRITLLIGLILPIGLTVIIYSNELKYNDAASSIPFQIFRLSSALYC